VSVPDDLLVAYFSLEFGLDVRLPIYAGGLGVLAGDHLKSASDLGVPLVGVGLFYRQGYFRQEVGPDGRQREHYDTIDPAALGLRREAFVAVELGHSTVEAAVWRIDVGSVPLLLLDTDVDGNPDWARTVTQRLYGGDRRTRLVQELVLGIGGVRALIELGFRPAVFHLNEGHAALTAIERVRGLVREGVPYAAALEQVRETAVFTTHTPVPAGNEIFDEALVREWVEPLFAGAGLPWEEFAAFGRGSDRDPHFGVTPFALRTAAHRNAVSRLHGEVARAMWADLWPDLLREQIPIGHVTNGVHPRTWLSAELAELLVARGVGVDTGTGWELVRELDIQALSAVRRRRKEELLEQVGGSLDPDVMTIGFARRFATYKRAGLLLSCPDDLAALLADADRPVQILFAGKAHPADEGGKDVMADVVALARSVRASGRVGFLVGYDMALARALVQGVDVWLNLPRRGEEASGTSGMKAALNGALNLSVLDGWWDEGYDEAVGWAIAGSGAEGDQDRGDALELFRLLDEAVLPAYYGGGGEWPERSRAAIAHAGDRFSSHRMVRQYVSRYYEPAHQAGRRTSTPLAR
jgi:starch phosphorylase